MCFSSYVSILFPPEIVKSLNHFPPKGAALLARGGQVVLTGLSKICPHGTRAPYSTAGPLKLYGPSTGDVELIQHFQTLPTFSDSPKKHFLEGWHFRIYPPPSEFTHHLQNLPTTFRKNRFWGRWSFLYLFGPLCLPQKRRFLPKWIFGKIDKLNDHLHMLNKP